MRRYRFVVCTVIGVTLIFSLFVIGYGLSSGSSHADRPAMPTERWKSIVDRGSGKGGWTPLRISGLSVCPGSQG